MPRICCMLCPSYGLLIRLRSFSSKAAIFLWWPSFKAPTSPARFAGTSPHVCMLQESTLPHFLNSLCYADGISWCQHFIIRRCLRIHYHMVRRWSSRNTIVNLFYCLGQDHIDDRMVGMVTIPHIIFREGVQKPDSCDRNSL